MFRKHLLAIGAALALSASVASAAVNIGDEPKLVFKATNGQQVDLAALKGKIVVIDFWAEVAKYEKDAAFIKRMNDSAASAKAKGALGLAQAYAKSGNAALAAKKYKSVIDEFPGTSFAEQAKREMAGLK